MNFNFYTKVTFTCKELGISRVVQLPFDTGLDKLSYLLYASLVETKLLEQDTFLMRFGDDVFITRMDEQENGFGYSYDQYRVLETEKFINVVLQNPKSASFELIDMKHQNYVFEMMMGDVLDRKNDEKLELLQAQGLLLEAGADSSYDTKKVLSLIKKNLPLVRKIYHFDR